MEGNCAYQIDFNCPKCKRYSCACHVPEMRIGIKPWDYSCECGYLFLTSETPSGDIQDIGRTLAMLENSYKKIESALENFIKKL